MDQFPSNFPYYKDYQMNEMVSTGDTEIILHIWSPRFRASRDGEYSGVTTENTQSAKICLNFNFRGGGGLSDLKFQRGALWRIWSQLYCVYRNLLVHHR